jgi:CRP-like cAMP-binding protein/CheY-like chemotaxis protein
MTTILIIEDNQDVRENTAEILELANYKVITAVNGKDGVELAQQHKPDLIICDIMMPELDGYGVLHVLSKHVATATIPFIFLTAKTEKQDVRKGMGMGADDYITKPFDEADLLNAIEARIKKNSLIKQEFQRTASGVEEFIEQAKTLSDLKDISKNRTLHHYKKKEVIFAEGNHPRGIFLLQKGKVKTYKSNEDGKDYIIGLYNEGDFFGYVSLLENSVYSENAEALENSEVYFIPREDFFTLISNNNEVASSFIKMLSNNLIEMEERMLKLAYNSVRKRVADSLLKLEKTYNTSGQYPFTISINREDMANMAGTSTETVIRTLSDFKDEKLIEVRASHVTLLNIEKLQKMRN